ncbi:MAG TPA: universal stress protein, partial [Phenylobacterium sp.]|nr:universal stress protein [Phenylobacterium sp.]
MSWARIMAPLSGGAGDADAVAAAIMLAEPFQAEMAGVYTPADVADVMPWMGEGFLGGVQTTALESLKEAAQAGETQARAAMEGVTYAKSRFVALQTPV